MRQRSKRWNQVRLWVCIGTSAVLFAVGLIVATHVPPFHRWMALHDRIHQRVLIYEFPKSDSVASQPNDPLPSSSPQWLTLNIQTGSVQVEQLDWWFRYTTSQDGKLSLYNSLHNPKDRKYLFRLSRDNGTVQELEAEFPGFPIPLDRYTVAVEDSDSIIIHDMNSGHRQVITGSGTFKNIISTGRSGSFVVLREVASSIRGKPPSYVGELFRRSAQGDIQAVSQFPIHSPETCCSVNGLIYVLDPVKSMVDVYVGESGQSSGSLPFPDDLTEMLTRIPFAQLFLTHNLLCVRSPAESSYWTLPDLKKLCVPGSCDGFIQPNVYANPWLWTSSSANNEVREIFAFEPQGQRHDWRYRTDGEMQLIDQVDGKEDLVIANSQYGLSVELLDYQTGKIIKRFVPFRWLSFVLPILILGFALCTELWIRLATRNGLALGWIIALPVLALSITLLVHLRKWGLFGRPEFAHNYLQGVFLGLYCAAHAWLVWGAGRLSLRYLPLVVVTGILVLLVRSMVTVVSLQVEAILTTVFTSLFVLIAFAILRATGLVRRPQVHELETGNGHAGIPMRDLFVACTCVAILLSVSMPIFPKLVLPNRLPPETWQMIVAELCMVGGVSLIALILFRYHQEFICQVAVSLLVILVTIEATYEFTSGYPLMGLSRESLSRVLFRGVSLCLVTFYFMALAHYQKLKYSPDGS
ncbi:MAG: hypothetical protein KDB03_19060 [Planctomycetales bacterium]|nr:hypothetical protein [Planctomycetales bacterium]